MAVELAKVEGGVSFTETKLAQPVNMQGQNGQIQQIKGVTQDITTKYVMSKEDMQMELIQQSKRRAMVVSQNATVLAQIDARIKDLNDAVALME